MVRIQYNGPGVLETIVDKYLVVLSIQLGDFYSVLPLITPVQVAANPVQCNAVRTLNC